jgi:hypothetical protein
MNAAFAGRRLVDLHGTPRPDGEEAPAAGEN